MIREPIDIKNSNVWENSNKQTQPILDQSKRTVIVIGGPKCGKTSFIKLLRGDYDLQSKPTRLIDYFTMKKQGVQIQIYELSSFKYIQTLNFLITPQNSSHLMIILCLDLTDSENLVKRINQQIETIRSRCKDIIEQKHIKSINNLYNDQRARYYQYIEKSDDIEMIQRMPFRFTIIGCKKDLFDKMKIEEKKWISRCLRYLAHTNQGNLIFSSTKSMQTAAELRSVVIDELLGVRSRVYSNQKDYNKAVFILAGEDRVAEMSLPAFNNSGAFNELKILEQQLESVFPSIRRIQLPEEQRKQFRCINLDTLIKKQRKQIINLMRSKGIKFSNKMNITMGSRTGIGFNMGMNDTLNNINYEKNPYQTSMRELMIKQQTKLQQRFMDEQEEEEDGEQQSGQYSGEQQS